MSDLNFFWNKDTLEERERYKRWLETLSAESRAFHESKGPPWEYSTKPAADSSPVGEVPTREEAHDGRWPDDAEPVTAETYRAAAKVAFIAVARSVIGVAETILDRRIEAHDRARSAGVEGVEVRDE